MGHNSDMKQIRVSFIFMMNQHRRFQNLRMQGSKDVGSMKTGLTDGWMEEWTDKPKSICPLKVFKFGG